MTSGISKQKWADTPDPKGFQPCPKGTGLAFEITDTREGHTDKGKRGPHDYLQVVCTYTDDEGNSFDVWEYFALVDDGLPWLKKFLTRTGRCDLMVEDTEWDELVGTTFLADVSHREDKSTGTKKAVLNYDSIVNVSHDSTEFVADEEEEQDDPPPKASSSKASPQRPARGRTGR